MTTSRPGYQPRLGHERPLRTTMLAPVRSLQHFCARGLKHLLPHICIHLRHLMVPPRLGPPRLLPPRRRALPGYDLLRRDVLFLPASLVVSSCEAYFCPVVCVSWDPFSGPVVSEDLYSPEYRFLLLDKEIILLFHIQCCESVREHHCFDQEILWFIFTIS